MLPAPPAVAIGGGRGRGRPSLGGLGGHRVASLSGGCGGRVCWRRVRWGCSRGRWSTLKPPRRRAWSSPVARRIWSPIAGISPAAPIAILTIGPIDGNAVRAPGTPITSTSGFGRWPRDWSATADRIDTWVLLNWSTLRKWLPSLPRAAPSLADHTVNRGLEVRLDGGLARDDVRPRCRANRRIGIA